MRLLERKIAAITGATSGSGRAIARRFAEEGATVVMLAHGEERLKQLASEIGNGSIGIPTDIADPSQVHDAFADIGERFAKLDVLVNNTRSAPARSSGCPTRRSSRR